MADIMDTAQGTISGDVAQIRSAIYGREVRASIAEAIELLDSSSQDAAQKADTAQTSAAGNADHCGDPGKDGTHHAGVYIPV